MTIAINVTKSMLNGLAIIVCVAELRIDVFLRDGVVVLVVAGAAVVVPEAAVVVSAAAVVVPAAAVVVPAAAVVVLAEIVGAVTAHGLASEHMVLSEATNPPFETKSVTPEESSEALPAKITVI